MFFLWVWCFCNSFFLAYLFFFFLQNSSQPPGSGQGAPRQRGWAGLGPAAPAPAPGPAAPSPCPSAGARLHRGDGWREEAVPSLPVPAEAQQDAPHLVPPPRAIAAAAQAAYPGEPRLRVVGTREAAVTRRPGLPAINRKPLGGAGPRRGLAGPPALPPAPRSRGAARLGPARPAAAAADRAERRRQRRRVPARRPGRHRE